MLVLLKLLSAHESPGRTYHKLDSNRAVLGRGLRLCISSKFPADASGSGSPPFAKQGLCGTVF